MALVPSDEQQLISDKMNDECLVTCHHRGTQPISLSRCAKYCGKNFLLWQALLEKYGYDDMDLAPFMTEGVKLVGMHDTLACYPAMLKPATLVHEDLESSSCWRRRAAVGQAPASDPSHEQLEAMALEEFELGFVEGPFLAKVRILLPTARAMLMAARPRELKCGVEKKLVLAGPVAQLVWWRLMTC